MPEVDRCGRASRRSGVTHRPPIVPAPVSSSRSERRAGRRPSGPAATDSSITVPARGARTSFCIFIASIVSSVAPSATSSPDRHADRHDQPGQRRLAPRPGRCALPPRVSASARTRSRHVRTVTGIRRPRSVTTQSLPEPSTSDRQRRRAVDEPRPIPRSGSSQLEPPAVGRRDRLAADAAPRSRSSPTRLAPRGPAPGRAVVGRPRATGAPGRRRPARRGLQRGGGRPGRRLVGRSAAGRRPSAPR